MIETKTNSTAGKFILLSTILASGMAFLDGSVVNVAVPTIQEKLHASITSVQWVINGYLLLLSALILISGALGDRFGRKRIFMYGIALFTFASFLCSITNSIFLLSLFRAVQGVGGAMMVPGSLSIINIAFSPTVRGRAIGLWSGFAGGISALGPFVGGWLVQTLGWQSIFYINIPIGILALLLTYRFVPESKNHESTNLDIAGAACIFIALLGIVYGLMSAPEVGWNNVGVIMSLVGGIIASVLFVIVELTSKQPLVPFGLFSSLLVIGANLATFFLYFALSGVTFFLVLNLQQVQHFSPLMSGIAMLPTILLITFLSGYGGKVADAVGPRLPMIIGPLVVAVGMGLFVFTGVNTNYFLGFFPGLVLFGLGMAFVIAPLTKSALTVEEKYSGTASGINNAVARIAGLLAIAFLGGVVLFLFKVTIEQNIVHSVLTGSQQQQIIVQENKLGAIEIPTSFPILAQQAARREILQAFVQSFRWAMGITALLAFISGVISFFTIKPRSHS
ncbi:MAG: MFS transporter [Patescibacteria group bacterium]|nr:MFS transporter [Patescibacteria group bacterium]